VKRRGDLSGAVSGADLCGALNRPKHERLLSDHADFIELNLAARVTQLSAAVGDFPPNIRFSLTFWLLTLAVFAHLLYLLYWNVHCYDRSLRLGRRGARGTG